MDLQLSLAVETTGLLALAYAKDGDSIDIQSASAMRVLLHSKVWI